MTKDTPDAGAAPSASGESAASSLLNPMHTFDRDARGVYLITVTPFTDSGALDLASTDRMVDFCLDRGVTGLTILGIMGEATKLTAEESRTFTRQVVQRVRGRVPIVSVWVVMRLPCRSSVMTGKCQSRRGKA